MEQRILGRTGRPVSIVGLGTWQLGADWGDVSETEALAVLDASVEAGVTFFDTADVYGDGKSETVIGRYLSANPDVNITVATKMGRREAQDPSNFTLAKFREWTDRSRRNLGVDRLDLVQLHCPPSSVFSSDAVYDALDTLVDDGAIANYGVSVETVDEALAAIARPGTASVQIILNAFRLKPLDEVLPAARAAGVGITFDVGETFSGVDFATGVRAATELSTFVPEGLTPAQAAIAWVTQQDGVSTVIPGARSLSQAASNATAGNAGPLPQAYLDAVRSIYDADFRAAIHDRW